MTEQESWRDRRWPTTTSISVFLDVDTEINGFGLLLVGIKEQWGLPGGGLEEGEYLIEAVRREIKEETGIDENDILFSLGPFFGTPSEEILPKHIICLPQPTEGRTQLGLVYEAVCIKPKLDQDGWEVKDGNDNQVNFTKPFFIPDILNLLGVHLKTTEECSSPLRKPHLNFPLLLTWLVRKGLYDEMPSDISEFLDGIQDKIPYLDSETFKINERKSWVYRPPCLMGTQIQKL